MDTLTVKMWIVITAAFCAFEGFQGTSLRLRQALLAAGDWLNDADGDNIPGRAGIDYPVHASVPEGTSFRCKDYDFAGYFGDVEAGCQAYHVCFPDGRNASFLCVNGTVFHQRYFVCDWWFHFNCSNGPSLYDLNLYRKIPLPVLPPVRRRQFPGPVPQPRVELPPPPPRTREPKNISMDPKKDRKDDKDPRQKRKPENDRNALPPSDRQKPFQEKRDRQDDKCNCQCGSSPAAMYVASAVQYE